MRPFKRKPVKTWDEVAATFPPALCGRQAEHWRWKKLEGLPCPVCKADKARADAVRERELLADAIATRVAEKLRNA